MEQSYWNESGKYQEFVDQVSDQMPDVGYTSNIYMNLFIAVSKIYYDVCNNGGCNIEDGLDKHFKRHVEPLMPKLNIGDFLYGNEVKMERALDAVCEFLQDKPLEYPVYSVWMKYAEKCFSRVEPQSPDCKDWSQIRFGLSDVMSLWCSEQETLANLRDVTEEVKVRNRVILQNSVPDKPNLPDFCYSVLSSTGELIILGKGESCYFKSSFSRSSRQENQALADHLNEQHGISKAQVLAMEVGSMFGWDKPGADPATYEKHSLQEVIAGAAAKANSKANNTPGRQIQGQER